MKTIITALALFSGVAVADTNAYSVESAIYKIEIPYTDGTRRLGFGTGVLVSPNKILTNCHVLDAYAGWPIVVHRKTGKKFAVLKHYNLGSYDACVLVGHFPGTPVQLSDRIKYGEPVWVYGYPRGLEVVSQGTIKSIVEVDSETAIESAVFCDRGSSGGPLLNAKGQLVGLNYKIFQYRNSCLSIPASLLMPYLNQ